jgi:hypothetical protein
VHNADIANAVRFHTAFMRFWGKWSMLLRMSVFCFTTDSSSLFSQTPSPHQPVLLISIDGMRPDYVTHADEHHLRISALRHMLAAGGYAEASSETSQRSPATATRRSLRESGQRSTVSSITSGSIRSENLLEPGTDTPI